MTEGAERAAWMVSHYRQALYDIADGLCESDELDGDTIKAIVRVVRRHHRAPRPDPHHPTRRLTKDPAEGVHPCLARVHVSRPPTGGNLRRVGNVQTCMKMSNRRARTLIRAGSLAAAAVLATVVVACGSESSDSDSSTTATDGVSPATVPDTTRHDH